MFIKEAENIVLDHIYVDENIANDEGGGITVLNSQNIYNKQGTIKNNKCLLFDGGGIYISE